MGRVAMNKSMVTTAKLILEATVVVGNKGNRRFPNPPCIDEGDKVFCGIDNFLDQLFESGAGPGCWRR